MCILRDSKPLFQLIDAALCVIGKLSQQILGALRLLLDGFLDQSAQVFLTLEDDAEESVWPCLVWSNAGHFCRSFVYFANTQALRVRADDSLHKVVVGRLVGRVKLAKELMVLEKSRSFHDIVSAVSEELKGAKLDYDGVHADRLRGFLWFQRLFCCFWQKRQPSHQAEAVAGVELIERQTGCTAFGVSKWFGELVVHKFELCATPNAARR